MFYETEGMLTLENGESEIVKLNAAAAMKQKVKTSKIDSKNADGQGLQNLTTK